MHASCALGDYVYVFCGTPGFFTTSFGANIDYDFALIECLDTKKENSPWVIINTPTTSSVEFLLKPAVAALNKNQVIIFGGQTVHEEKEVYSDDTYGHDAVVFDIRDHSMKRFFPIGITQGFICHSNTCIQAGDDVILANVSDSLGDS